MTARDLILIYVMVGVAAGTLVCRRGAAPRRAWSVLGSALLWPLWAPFTLLGPSKRQRHEEPEPEGAACHPSLEPIDRALRGAVSAVAGTVHAPLFSPEAASRFREIAARAAERLAELEAALAAERAAPELEGAVAVTNARRETICHLRELRAAAERELVDLAVALETLHYRLLSARFEEAERGDTGALVADARAQLEALAEAATRSMPRH
jgi:hypothetical protein